MDHHTKEESSYFTDFWEDDPHTAPILYPGEAFTLWKLHLLTQDLPLTFYRWDIMSDMMWDIRGIEDLKPYDPHDPQISPYTFGLNFSKKEDSMEYGPKPWITAGPGEYELSNDPESRRKTDYNPSCVVRLTREAARGAGLIPIWWPWFEPLPGRGESIRFMQAYDWDSPKWAWDGAIRGNGTQRKKSGDWKMECKRRKVDYVSGLMHRLPGATQGHVQLGSEHATR